MKGRMYRKRARFNYNFMYKYKYTCKCNYNYKYKYNYNYNSNTASYRQFRWYLLGGVRCTGEVIVTHGGYSSSIQLSLKISKI